MWLNIYSLQAVPLKILTDSLSLPEGERPGKLYLIGMAAMLVACQLVIAIIVTSIKPVMMAREGALLLQLF